MKIAFCFPGQGSQDVGMGRASRRSSVARPCTTRPRGGGLRRGEALFRGSLEELTRTELQPALVATSIACLRGGEDDRIEPDYVIGHSVGEYSALAAADAIGTGDAVALSGSAARRWPGARTPGAMAAVLGLEDAVVEELLSIDGVWPANYNCPVVVSVKTPQSTASSRRRLLAGAQDEAARGGAFHSPLVARPPSA